MRCIWCGQQGHSHAAGVTQQGGYGRAPVASRTRGRGFHCGDKGDTASQRAASTFSAENSAYRAVTFTSSGTGGTPLNHLQAEHSNPPTHLTHTFARKHTSTHTSINTSTHRLNRGRRASWLLHGDRCRLASTAAAVAAVAAATTTTATATAAAAVLETITVELVPSQPTCLCAYMRTFDACVRCLDWSSRSHPTCMISTASIKCVLRLENKSDDIIIYYDFSTCYYRHIQHQIVNLRNIYRTASKE